MTSKWTLVAKERKRTQNVYICPGRHLQEEPGGENFASPFNLPCTHFFNFSRGTRPGKNIERTGGREERRHFWHSLQLHWTLLLSARGKSRFLSCFKGNLASLKQEQFTNSGSARCLEKGRKKRRRRRRLPFSIHSPHRVEWVEEAPSSQGYIQENTRIQPGKPSVRPSNHFNGSVFSLFRDMNHLANNQARQSFTNQPTNTHTHTLTLPFAFTSLVCLEQSRGQSLCWAGTFTCTCVHVHVKVKSHLHLDTILPLMTAPSPQKH